jgi:transposase
MERPMSQPFDASRSLIAFEQDSTIIAVIEMAQSKWLVAAVVPGIKRSMVAIPTIEEEDAKRPNRERDSLVTEQTRIGNQIKAILTRFGVRTFRPKLRKAEQQLKELRTAEGSLLPENTRAELFRHPRTSTHGA